MLLYGPGLEEDTKVRWAQTELTSFVRLRPRYLDTIKSDGVFLGSHCE